MAGGAWGLRGVAGCEGGAANTDGSGVLEGNIAGWGAWRGPLKAYGGQILGY